MGGKPPALHHAGPSLPHTTMLKSIAAALTLTLAFAGPSRAQSDELGKCMTDNTTGKDRKELARWIFISVAAHPHMGDIARVSEDASEKSSRAMAAIVTRLLTESCPNEAKAVVKNEGRQGMKRAFEILGQIAMLELTSDKQVSASVGQFERYIDHAKFNAVFEGK